MVRAVCDRIELIRRPIVVGVDSSAFQNQTRWKSRRAGNRQEFVNLSRTRAWNRAKGDPIILLYFKDVAVLVVLEIFCRRQYRVTRGVRNTRELSFTKGSTVTNVPFGISRRETQIFSTTEPFVSAMRYA